MKFYRKLLILFVIILTILLVLRFVQKRVNILKKSNNISPLYLESFSLFSSNTAETEAAVIQKQLESIPPGIVNISAAAAELPLNQYFIKGSANSAYSGSFVSTNMLKVVLSRGCRFLDFQIFVSKDVKTGDTIAVVGVRLPDGTASKNQIPLVDVLKTILVSGMNTDSPNTKDPLFVQFRISNPEIYEIVGMHVNKYLATTPFLYLPKDEMIHSKMPLKQLLNKIILAIDVGLSPDYANPKNYKESHNNLKQFVAMETNTSDIPSYDSYDMAAMNITAPVFVNPSPNQKNTNITKCTIVNPGKDTGSNPKNYKSFVKNHGYNVILYQFDLVDVNGPLGEYETIFGAKDGIHTLSDFRNAFISMADMLHFIKSP
jgi:hypothetical protein